MKNKKEFEVQEFTNIKDIIYNVSEKYSEKIAFIIKHKENNNVEYENITYKKITRRYKCFRNSFI